MTLLRFEELDLDEIDWSNTGIVKSLFLALLQDYVKLKKKVEDLEKRLRAYENPHTPSSKRRIREKKEPKEPLKKGAPVGHNGGTRRMLVPDRVVRLEVGECPRCGSRDLVEKKCEKAVEDVEINKVVTRYEYSECRCINCGREFTTVDEGLVKAGVFGPNILSLWLVLHYIGTIPFERLSQISGNCFGVDITPGGLHNVIYRTVGLFNPCFRRIRGRVVKSGYVRSDETGYSFNGIKHWLWNISTKEDVLVLIRDNRSSRVLKEVFGDFLNGVLNSDCLKTYECFKAREYQKCWAHVLRDARDLAKHSEEGKQLHKMLSNMYQYIDRVKKNQCENTPKVRRWITQSQKKINSWAKENHASKAVLNLVLRMSKYGDHWFTCLKHSFVEPTNNSSERDIRKNVLAKKISGLHRSDLGVRCREIMMSTILTIQKRSGNPYEHVLNTIVKHNLNPNMS